MSTTRHPGSGMLYSVTTNHGTTQHAFVVTESLVHHRLVPNVIYMELYRAVQHVVSSTGSVGLKPVSLGNSQTLLGWMRPRRGDHSAYYLMFIEERAVHLVPYVFVVNGASDAVTPPWEGTGQMVTYWLTEQFGLLSEDALKDVLHGMCVVRKFHLLGWIINERNHRGSGIPLTQAPSRRGIALPTGVLH